jgi:hypothetical protein
MLLEDGANPNKLDITSQSPMHLAVSAFHMSTLCEMLPYGGNMALQDRYGQLVLFWTMLRETSRSPEFVPFIKEVEPDDLETLPRELSLKKTIAQMVQHLRAGKQGTTMAFETLGKCLLFIMTKPQKLRSNSKLSHLATPSCMQRPVLSAVRAKASSATDMFAISVLTLTCVSHAMWRIELVASMCLVAEATNF